MTAVALLCGQLTAQDYEDEKAKDPRIDALRNKMVCIEDPQYTKDYLDPEKRSIANAIQIFYKDGSISQEVAVEYPIGHRKRRNEGIPELIKKYKINLARIFDQPKQKEILDLCLDHDQFLKTDVIKFMDMLAK